MTFLRNCWYVACWSDDLERGPFARTILGQPVVFYRREDGAPVALEDRCCHRGLPLSMGRVKGDDIECGYHGLTFEPSGACVRVPGQGAIPPDAKVRAFPVAEKWRSIWIWMGDPARADEARIPNVFWLDHPEWAAAPGYSHMNANYQLLVDNLLDLTHVTYLHTRTIAADDAEALIPVTTERHGDTVRVGRWIHDIPPPPMYAAARDFAGKVDRWQWITWEAPSTVYLDIGCADAGTGAPEGDRSQGISMWSTHLITPETETTTHYHWGFARDYKLDDESVTELLREGGRMTFTEDVEVLEIQQRALQATTGRPKVDINIDNAPLQARRILEELIEEEQPAARTAAE